MKAVSIFLFGLGAGAVAVATYWWLPGQSRGEPPRPAPAGSSSIASQIPAENRPATAPYRPPVSIHAIVRARLRQGRNTRIDETTTHEAITMELVGMLSDDNTAEIVRSLSPQELPTLFGSAAVKRWLDIAPAEAASWLATRPDATEHQASLVARRFREIPAALHVYCDQLPPSTWKEQVLQHASLDLADTDPTKAITFAQRIAPGDTRIDAFETIAYAWFGRDPTAALRWAQTIPDSTLRERLFAVGAKAIARADPDLALDWLVTGVHSDELFRETALSIVEVAALQMPD